MWKEETTSYEYPLKMAERSLPRMMSFASLTACGSDSSDNGAVKQEDDTMNDATDGTRDEGVLDEAGDEVRGEAEDMADEGREGMGGIKN